MLRRTALCSANVRQSRRSRHGAPIAFTIPRPTSAEACLSPAGSAGTFRRPRSPRRPRVLGKGFTRVEQRSRPARPAATTFLAAESRLRKSLAASGTSRDDSSRQRLRPPSSRDGGRPGRHGRARAPFRPRHAAPEHDPRRPRAALQVESAAAASRRPAPKNWSFRSRVMRFRAPRGAFDIGDPDGLRPGGGGRP
jgi:hypothetical protein